MAIDLEPLWNFSDATESERRMRAALARAAGDDALILQTRIARSYGLRQEFDKARELLESIRPRIASAGPEARVRHALEDALVVPLRLERESEAANAPDRYVFEELEILYRERGDQGRAEHYAALKAAASK